ncbi:MAG: RNA polymerase sigma factor [Bdellovibrionaceae bacterium]|jgi:RNA polymerase sigma-70 factor, ECF subfamily|nr:RNA polymerase sigma factor [Pseudobdellovibrionaceae bacterium]
MKGLNLSTGEAHFIVSNQGQAFVSDGSHLEIVDFKSKKDTELVTDVKEGVPGAFSELVERHRKYMMALVFKMTRDASIADDVVQEALMKAYTKIHLFRGTASFKSWLFRITVNTAKNVLRSKSRYMTPMEENTVAVESKGENKVYNSNLNEIFVVEINLLPDRQRMALKLRVFDDLNFKEIAEIMQCPYDTAKANYRHALLKLKKKFKNVDFI